MRRQDRVNSGVRASGAVVFGCAALATLLVACGTGRVPPVAARGAPGPATTLNSRLVSALAAQSRTPSSPDYRVGPGDMLEITVFQAEELNRTVRVRPDGTISLPLVGLLRVSGRTTGELEALLADRYGADYLREPQLSVLVQEYRAHPVSVLGEVNQPGTYYLQAPRTLVEILSQAGGLTEHAGTIAYLRREKQGSESDVELVSIDLSALLSDGERGLELTVRDNDTLFVPKAGVVFVDGAVRKPGTYPLQGAPTVLKAVAMAGGMIFEAKPSSVQLIRNAESGPVVTPVNLSQVRADPALDPRIQDGDVVVVGTSSLKVGLMTFLRGVAGLVSVTAGL